MNLAFELALCLFRDASQGTRLQRVAGLSGLGEDGTKALHEVLVGVGRVELYDLVIAALFPVPLGDAPGHEGLAGARGALKDDLSLVLQPVDYHPQPVRLPHQLTGQLVQGLGHLRRGFVILNGRNRWQPVPRPGWPTPATARPGGDASRGRAPMPPR